jgi:hypothetical protein
LVVLCGPPAVGKLTVGRELARLTGFRLFHNHLTVDLVGSVFESGTEPNVRLREEIWLTLFDYACRYGVPGLVFTLAVANWSPTAEFLSNVERVVDGRGAVHYVELTCEREELLTRVVQPSRAAYDKVNDTDTLEGWLDDGKIKLPQIERPGVLRIDNTALAPHEVARRIVEHFGLLAPGRDARHTRVRA